MPDIVRIVITLSAGPGGSGETIKKVAKGEKAKELIAALAGPQWDEEDEMTITERAAQQLGKFFRQRVGEYRRKRAVAFTLEDEN